MANPSISHIFGSVGFILKLARNSKLTILLLQTLIDILDITNTLFITYVR